MTFPFAFKSLLSKVKSAKLPVIIGCFLVLSVLKLPAAGTATRLLWATQPGQVTNGLVFGQSPVLKTADVNSNFSTVGLPAVKVVQVGLYSGSGTLTGVVTANIGTSGGNGTVTLTNLLLSTPGRAQLIAYDTGPGFNPTNISAAASCQLWLDAADLNTLNLSGSTVVAWADKSGKNNSATGGTSPALATDTNLSHTASGLSQTVRFDGVGTFLGMNLNSLSGSPYTIICLEIATNKGAGNSSYFLGNNGGNNTDLTLHVGYNSPTEWRWGQYGDDLNFDTSFTFPTIRLSTEKITAAKAESLYFNSVQVASRPATGFLTGSSLVNGTVGQSLSAYYQGDLAELIVYNSALSDTDRSNVETYLMTKWSNGITSATSSIFNVVQTNGLLPLSAVTGIYRELWTGLSTPGNGLAGVTNTTLNPNWPNNPTASFTKIFTNFETEINTGMDDYGQRVRAFVVPPTNGNYTFWISSDDTSDLFLSPGESPTNKTQIALVTGYTDSRQWTKYPGQQSAPIALQGGVRYYLEAIMEQEGGGDNLAVRWQLPNGVIEEPLNAASPAGTLLMPCNGVDTSPQIYSQTGNVTAVERSSFVLSVLMANEGPMTYQWRLNNLNIANAKTPIFAITNASVATNNGQVYTCVISNSVGVITNASITLNITRDITPPSIVSVQNIGSNNVAITFSEGLAKTTATTVAHYVFTNGLSVTGASLDATGTIVTLTTAPLVYGSNYSIVINGIQDLAATPNTIVPNTTINFTALPFALLDIGGSGVTSVITYQTNGETVAAVGSDIGGTTDQFSLDYQTRTGNFDVNVRVAGLGLSDIWAKAGLMAREALNPGSRFTAAVATPAMNGCYFEWRDPSNTVSSSTGNFPANFPNTWLRLKRLGNVFTGFASYDGQTWTQLGTATITMSNQVYLGYAVSSHGTNVTTAQFLDEADVTGNTNIGTVVNPREIAGPSSRTTPVVFSEIMYKPAPRTDGKNLEFIEIYNSNPFFQDISSYQIICADMNYTFSPNTQIPGGGHIVIAAAPADIQSVYGITNVMGPYTGSLKKSETLQLNDERGAVLLTVPYSTTYPWPVAADGSGHSIILANPSYGEGDPRAWDISDIVGGSPGQAEAFRPSPLRNIVINEILPHSENVAVPQFIELYNHSTNTVDLSGCILTDDTTTNKFTIPGGTTINPAGFVSFTVAQFGFPLDATGGTVYLIKPDNSRILDAVQYGPQSDGVSFGRSPDGANDFYNFTTRTPGTNNSPILIGDIVINELMYDPITENDDDQYIELYNKGSNTVSLAGWQLTTGVTFNFPPTASLASNAYLVVARNVTNLLAKYPNLNGNNTVGNFSGKLSHNGELLALVMPQTLNGTNTILVTEDEVTYGVGGRWGEWSGGGGSSLELIDPNSNHRLAANWADSDETAKAPWTDIEATGVLDNGANYDSAIDYAQIGILDVGECLVDNIEVDYNGANYVTNSTFETGTNGWSFQGCEVRSSLENTGFGGSAHSLHIRNSDHVWTGVNSCQVALSNTSLQPGQTVTLRFQARWLHGWPEALLRLNGNWLEAAGPMQLPLNLGSPGLPNSRKVANAGPAIYAVTHTPTLPAANQPAVVTAEVHDANGVQNLTLHYRIDPSTNYVTVVMKDDGTGGDAIAGDGIYSATIPGQSANVLAAFYLSATDTNGASTRFPALTTDNLPVRECLILFGDGNPAGSFGVYHMWISQTNVNRWAALSDLSNEENDGTFVTDKRVVYNMSGRFAGSPYHQDFDTPVGNLCHYKWTFPDDDKFLGATDFNKIHQPGNYAGDDATLQKEQLANTFLRALGIPWLNRRFVVVFVNGNQRGTLMEDTQTPGSDIVKEHYPNDSDGFLYKMQPWFEFAPFPTGSTIDFDNQSWCNFEPYTTTGNVKKVARYRYNFLTRRTPDSASNYTNVFNLVDAASSSASPNFVANLEGQADMENWLRMFAANHAAGNWDAIGGSTGQNVYGYVGTQGTKYSLLMWDFNLVIGNSQAWLPGQNLFVFNGEDPNIQNIFNNPTFLRMYWRALQDLVNGPLDPVNSGPLLMAKYNVMVANGYSVESPTTVIEPWISQAKTSIAAQLAAVNASSFTVNPTTTSNNIAYLTGTAPVNVSSISINGVEYPLTWTSLTGWTIALPLVSGNNTFSVVGVDQNGLPITGASNSVTVALNATLASPIGHVVINEIMANPVVPGAQFIELYNNSTTTAFDLSGWQLTGLGYTFPTGSLLGPTNFLVLTANRDAFANNYGANIPVLDIFTGTLQPGQILSLVQPITSSSNLVVTEIKTDAVLPWPTNTIATGNSLQLIDSTQDNWRVANWAAKTGSATPGAVNSVAAALPPFPTLWLNEVEPNNVTGIVNSAGQHGAWLELYNPGSNSLSLTGLYLANSYTNLLQWTFPAGTTISAGQFKIIFADGQTNLSTPGEPHTSFVLSNATGSLALSRSVSAQAQVLDYIDYANLLPDNSYGSSPDGQSFVRQIFVNPTPGIANVNATPPPPSSIAYQTPGAIYTQNFDSLPNPGATSVNTTNPVTINNVTYSLGNPFDFAYPVSPTGNGGLGLEQMAGWYGLADPTAKVGTRFGATDGDQTTGGQLSFGLPNSSNRSLGLLATSTTGFTAFGAKFVNETSENLKYLNVQFTGEVWRQSDTAKNLQVYYFVDPTATNGFSTALTSNLPALNVSFPTFTADKNGVAVDGTAAANQINCSVTNQVVNWPPGAALWITWEMASTTGKAQGLGIDNFSFSALPPFSGPAPALGSASLSNGNLVLSFPTVVGPTYQIESNTNLGVSGWVPVGNSFNGTGASVTQTNTVSSVGQTYFRLKIIP